MIDILCWIILIVILYEFCKVLLFVFKLLKGGIIMVVTNLEQIKSKLQVFIQQTQEIKNMINLAHKETNEALEAMKRLKETKDQIDSIMD